MTFCRRLSLVDHRTQGTPCPAGPCVAQQRSRRSARIAAVPLPARHPRQVRGEARIAGDEVDEGERQVLAHALMPRVLVLEALDRPVELGLRVAVEVEARRPVGPADGS